MEFQKYLPFLSPPDFSLAQRHYRSTLVPHPFEPSIQCPCCKQRETFYRPSFVIRTKDLLFLGPQIPYLFYFLQIVLLLIVCSGIIAVGQFIACGMSNDQNCQILRVQFDVFNKRISIPVGFSDIVLSMEYIYIAVIGVYFIVIFLLQFRINYRYLQLSDQKLGYSDFSIILNNVPPSTTKNQVQQFMKHLSSDVKSVTLIKKSRMFRKMLKYKREAKKKLNKAMKQAKGDKINQYTFEYAQMNSLIDKYQINQTQTRYRTKQVFVTFNTLIDKQRFLNMYEKGIFHKIYFRIFPSCSYTSIRENHIEFRSAPPPNDIIWKNLEKPFFTTRLRRFLSNVISFIAVLFGASITFGLNTFPSTFLLGIIIGAVIQITNYFIVYFINFSISYESYWTHTETKVCQVNRLTFYLFLNVTLIPFLLYMYGRINNQDKDFIWNEMGFSVLFISLSNMFKPFILFFDIGYYLKCLKRYNTKKKGVRSTLCQFQAHELFQAPEFQIHVIYSLIISSLLSTFFFISKMPVLIIPQIILIILMILMTRYLLTRRCKVPFRFTNKLSNCSNLILKWCIPLLFLGHILFNFLQNLSVQFFRQFIQNAYQGSQLGIMIMYIIVIIILDVPKYIAEKYVKRKKQRQNLQRPAFLNNSMNYAQSNPMFRLLQEQELDDQNIQRIPDQEDLRRQIQIQFEEE